MMLHSFFPDHWSRHKVDEVRLAIYICLLASLLWLDPSIMPETVYGAFTKVMQPREWSLTMFPIVLAHAFALYLNGRSPFFSMIVRAFACSGHLCIGLSFAVLFWIEGLLWGTLTYTFLVSLPLYGVMAYTTRGLVREYGKWKSSRQT